MTKYLKKTHVIKKNIITFEINDPVTRKVTNFYKESPFPNYKSDDNKSTIIKKGNKKVSNTQIRDTIREKKLKETIPLLTKMANYQIILQLAQIIKWWA